MPLLLRHPHQQEVLQLPEQPQDLRALLRPPQAAARPARRQGRGQEGAKEEVSHGGLSLQRGRGQVIKSSECSLTTK